MLDVISGSDRRTMVPGAKIAVPAKPARLVSRPRLLAALDSAAGSGSTLVRAPAGSGKTLLLAEWARRRGDVAWVSIDSDDNDTRRFWSALLAALASCPAVSPDDPVRTLAVPNRPDPDFLTAATAGLPASVRLVLDGIDELTEPGPLAALTLLSADPRLMLVCRHDPPVRLATELRAEELRFTEAEAAALLATARIGLPPHELAALVEHTEGWAAGLGLAALAVHDADYLATEVLADLPAATRELLRVISVCDQVSTDLATALSGPPNVLAMLAGLRHDDLVRDTHVWTPLRSHLLADLSRQTPRRAAALHATAADWFAAHDEPAHALTHAGRAGDADRTTRLLRRHGATLALSGDHATVLRAIDTLDDDSTLSLTAALAHLARGDIGTADRHTARAEAEAELLPIVRSCRAQAAGDTENLAASAALIPTTDPVLDTLATLHTGTALLATGHRGAAGVRLRAALVKARTAGQDYLACSCLTALAWLAAADGDFRRMSALAGEADLVNTAHGWHDTLAAATIDVLVDYGALLGGRPIQRVPAPGVGGGIGLAAATLRGAADCGAGDWPTGLHRIRAARAAADESQVLPSHLALCAVLEHRAAVQLGLRDAARDVTYWAQQWLPDSAELLLLRARSQLALGRHELAGTTIAPVLTGEVPAHLPWSVIDAWVLTGAAARDTDRAHAALDRALALAESMHVLYPLVFAPPGLLADRPGAEPVLLARRQLPGSPVPLTERERAVLCLLPTLHSFEEIAQDLTVSVNTVKTHVRAIYAKLGVGRRRDAVVAAGARGLLGG